MEIKYKARVAAKPWPAQSDASGHSPCGHHAHPARAQHGPEELGNGSSWASSLQHWTHRALPGPFGLCRAGGTTRAHYFWGGRAAATAFSDSRSSSSSESSNCLSWKRLLRLRSFKITKFIKPALQRPPASEPSPWAGSSAATQGAAKQQLRDAKA